jgi:hypothetical protein
MVEFTGRRLNRGHRMARPSNSIQMHAMSARSAIFVAWWFVRF